MGKRGPRARVSDRKVRTALTKVPEEYKGATIYACMRCAKEDKRAVYINVGDLLNAVFRSEFYIRCPMCGYESVFYDDYNNDALWFCPQLKSHYQFLMTLEQARAPEEWDPQTFLTPTRITASDMRMVMDLLAKQKEKEI